jgi:ribonuclease Z
MLQPVEQVTIHANPITLERVRLMTGFIGRGLQYALHWHELQEGLVFTHRQLACYAFPTRHRVRASYGFVFQEKPRRRFLAEVAAQLGVPKGPERPVVASSFLMRSSGQRNLARSSSTSAIACILLN